MKPIETTKQGKFGRNRTFAIKRDDSRSVDKHAYGVRFHTVD